MCHHHNDPAGAPGVEVRQQALFGRRVERRRRFIKDHDGTVLKQRPRNRDALFLATGQARAHGAQRCIPP